MFFVITWKHPNTFLETLEPGRGIFHVYPPRVPADLKGVFSKYFIFCQPLNLICTVDLDRVNSIVSTETSRITSVAFFTKT